MEKGIKLLYVGKMDTGTIRLQSQLFIGRDCADFILKNKKLRVWGYNKHGGLGFHETKIPYEIVYKKEDMISQII